MALPSGYEVADIVYRVQVSGQTTPYFNLGVVPSSEMKFNILFDTNNSYVTGGTYWMFGSRKSSSNTSAEQLNLYYGGSGSASQLGYASARISLGTNPFSNGASSFLKNANEFVINNGNTTIIEKTGATTVFENATQPMYLFALNNAGTALEGSGAFNDSYANIKIEQNGAVTHNYIPVFDVANNEQCLYDTTTDTVIQKSGSGNWTSFLNSPPTHHLLIIDETSGGIGYAETKWGQQVKKIYCHHHNYSQIPVNVEEEYDWMLTRLQAVSNNGYSFVGWEYDGSVISKEETIYVSIGQDATIKAVFVKNTANIGMHHYQLMGLRYGTSDNADVGEQYIYADVLSANLNIDGMAKTTSTIVCKEIPSTFLINTVVFLKNPKGKIVYTGIVNSINDKTITCREPLGLFDSDFVFPQTSNSTQSLMREMYSYLGDYQFGTPYGGGGSSNRNQSVARKMSTTQVALNTEVSIENAANMNITHPINDSVQVSNLEDYLLNAFNEFGIYVEPRFFIYSITVPAPLPPFNPTGKVKFSVINPKTKQAIKIGNNVESVSNVEIDVQEIECTVLQIYNSSGSTLRGIYSVRNDGTIMEYYAQNSGFIAYDSCKLKVVMSDDKLNVLLEQYLSNAKYNHKISFDLSLESDLYSLEDFSIGRRVDFYYNDKMYSSIVTGKSWEISENTEEPSLVKITLGKVRNKLTIKLNLQKSKKK